MPSYRGSTFLDPKGRGAATGYDNAVALPAAADAGAFGAALLGRYIVLQHRLPEHVGTRWAGDSAGLRLHLKNIVTTCLEQAVDVTHPHPLPHADEYLKENVKSAAAMKGEAVFSIAKVDAATGEIAGVFESVQPSDTDLGAKAPKDVKITGLWYARLS